MENNFENKFTPPMYDNPNRCIKDDKESNAPCVCPKCMENTLKPKKDYIPKGIVLTDDNLSSHDLITRTSWEFTCTECGETKNPDYAKHCIGCGVFHIKRSFKVMEFLERYVAQNNSKENR